MEGKTKSLAKAASHVHVGAHGLKDIKTIVDLLLLYSAYENIIFRFGYGEDLQERPGILRYSKLSSTDLWDKASVIERYNLSYNEVVDYLIGPKCCSVNFNNMIRGENILKKNNTIEFRYANGTLNPIIWQNLVNLDLNMFEASNTGIDRDLIISRYKQFSKYAGDIRMYREIFLEQALEFVDLVFKNNADKIYFLAQYLKHFNTENSKINEPFTRIMIKHP